MKGKILGAGAISGEYGVCYYYDDNEVKNLKSEQKIDGCEVDFDVKDGKAVSIYITKTSFNIDTQQLFSNDLANIKLQAYITIGLFALVGGVR